MGVIALDGRGEEDEPKRWALTTGPADDVEIVESIVAELVPCIDQFFVTGFSNGAAFSVVMACRSELNIVALAPVSFATGPCESSDPTPIVSFHGTADGTVPYDGSGADVLAILLGLGSGPAEEVMANWAVANGCGTRQDTEIAFDVDRLEWTNCLAQTVFYRIDDGGHAWPGSGVEVRFGSSTNSISASEIIVDFFSAQLS